MEIEEIKKLHPKKGDVFVAKIDLHAIFRNNDSNIIEKQFRQVAELIKPGRLIILSHNSELSQVNEKEMRKAGWRRIEDE